MERQPRRARRNSVQRGVAKGFEPGQEVINQIRAQDLNRVSPQIAVDLRQKPVIPTLMFALKRMRAEISHETFVSVPCLIGALPKIRNDSGPKQRALLTRRCCCGFTHNDERQVRCFAELYRMI